MADLRRREGLEQVHYKARIALFHQSVKRSTFLKCTARLPQSRLAYDDNTGEYSTHCVSQEHTLREPGAHTA